MNFKILIPIMLLIFTMACISNQLTLPPKHDNVLVWGSIGDAKTLNPLLVSDSASSDIVGLVYDSLIGIDPKTLKPYPRLAESWEISEDGLQYTFHLKQNLKFHDGSPLTSEDVKFTFDKFKDPETDAPNQDSVQYLKSVENPDPYTVIFNLSKPDCSFMLTTGTPIIPKHIYESENINQSKFNSAPIGSGPFTFYEWKADDHITAQAFGNFFSGKPHLDKIIYKIVPDNLVLTEQLSTQEVDVTGIEPDQVKRLSQNPNLNIYSYPTNTYTYLGFNLQNEFFKDKKVRQAIAHAIDKDAIVESVLFGFGETANVPMAKISWAFNPNTKALSFDPVLAKKLLSEAGFTDADNDGILDKNGKPFSFEIKTNKGNKQREKIAVIIQHYLKQIGIDVRVSYLEWPTFIDQIDNKQFDAVILGWSLGLDPDASGIWHSEKAGKFNFISFKNENVNKILDEALIVPKCDLEKRKQLYWQFQEIIAEEQPYIFLYYSTANVGVNKKFTADDSIFANPLGILWNIERWKIKPEYLQ